MVKNEGLFSASEYFRSTSNQVLVKDDVVFAPPLDPNIALNRANENIRAGRSLFSESAKHDSLQSKSDK